MIGEYAPPFEQFGMANNRLDDVENSVRVAAAFLHFFDLRAKQPLLFVGPIFKLQRFYPCFCQSDHFFLRFMMP